ncbi:MAG: MarR family transcriptional regulator [Sphingomicrobium sp.]
MTLADNKYTYYMVVMDTLPFEIAETAHALRRAFDRRATSLGVTRAQWKVMFRLDRSPGLKQVELAEMLDIEPITLCRIIDRLEEAGLVERRRDPGDRRAWLLFLTATARPLKLKLDRLGEELIEEAYVGLDLDTLAVVRGALETIRNNVGRSAAPAKAANQ